jgi:hypothetical protein
LEGSALRINKDIINRNITPNSYFHPHKINGYQDYQELIEIQMISDVFYDSGFDVTKAEKKSNTIIISSSDLQAQVKIIRDKYIVSIQHGLLNKSRRKKLREFFDAVEHSLDVTILLDF